MRVLCLFLAAALHSQDPSFSLTEPVLIKSDQIEVIQDIVPMPKSEKNATLCVALSSLFPGLGHIYLGDGKTGSSLMGSATFGLGVAHFSDHEDSRMPGIFTFQIVNAYGMYAAYRDVRNYNGQTGYQYKMPNDSFKDLALASFNPWILKKPEVWGGFLGALGIAIGTSLLLPDEAKAHAILSSKLEVPPYSAFLIGISEECLFRGFLQSSFAEKLSPWGGIAFSSLIFGAAHIPNALLMPKEVRPHYYKVTLPFITAMGVYFGWLTQKNNSLRESVALHSWYDFTLFAVSAAIKDKAASTGHPTYFGIDFCF